MAKREEIKPIYSELQGCLSQAPSLDKYVTIHSADVWEHVNGIIDELSNISDEDYSRYKMTPKKDAENHDYIAIDAYRTKLNGLIMRLHGKYFPDETPPFSGIPTTSINISPRDNQDEHTNSKELRILDKILNAANMEVPIVALVAFVILLTLLNVLINSLEYLDKHSGWKLIIICIFSVLYFLAIIILILGRKREQKFNTAKDHIQIYLIEKLKRMSYDHVREDIDKSYTDRFLDKLVKKFPKVFRNCAIKTSEGTKRGITLTQRASQDT